MNACPDLLAALRQRKHDLELQIGAVRARLEEVRDMIAWLERPARRSRSRKPEAPSEQPIHVEGAAHEPPADTDTTDTELPL